MSVPLRLLCFLPCLLPGPAASAAHPAPAAVRPVQVEAVNSHLKRAEANLELVAGSIGDRTTPPKGSAAKLSQMRLEQAFGDLKPAGETLAKLGAGAGVAEARARYEAAVKEYDRLRAILTGEPPKPTPKPGPTPEPAPGPEDRETPAKPETVKLGYPHADHFKNTLFTLRRVEADAAGLVQLVEELRPVADPLTIDHRTTASALATIAETRRQAGFVRDGLAKIPANGEGVAAAQQRLTDAHGQLDAAAAYLGPLDARLAEVVNPANYPELEADVKRLSELAGAYRNLDYLFREQRAQAAEAYGQAEAAKAECLRIARVYARLLQQKTDHGKRIEAAGNGFLAQHAAFLAAAEAQKASLPAEIRADLGEADRQANEAVQNQKPLWFTGGIPQVMEGVDDKLALYSTLDPAGAGPLAAEVEAMKSSLRARADSLRELIIRENPLPADRFAGADRDAAIAVAIDGWKVQQPDFELLAVRIPAEAWARETKWTYSNGTWYYSDRSSLQVRLIVADDDNSELAIDRPINVRKDHQKGDAMIGVPLRSIDEALEPGEYLLRSRVP